MSVYKHNLPLFYSMALNELFKDLKKAEVYYQAMNQKRNRSPKRRGRSKPLPASSNDTQSKLNGISKSNGLKLQKNTNSTFTTTLLPQGVLDLSTFLYNLNVTMLILSFEEGRCTLRR